MSLPTAHRYVIESLMENLSSIEKNFLKPNCVIPIIDFFMLKEGDFVPKSVIFEIKRLFNTNE